MMTKYYLKALEKIVRGHSSQDKQALIQPDLTKDKEKMNKEDLV